MRFQKAISKIDWLELGWRLVLVFITWLFFPALVVGIMIGIYPDLTLGQFFLYFLVFDTLFFINLLKTLAHPPRTVSVQQEEKTLH